MLPKKIARTLRTRTHDQSRYVGVSDSLHAAIVREYLEGAYKESMVESLTLNGCATSVRIESGCVGAPPLLTLHS